MDRRGIEILYYRKKDVLPSKVLAVVDRGHLYKSKIIVVQIWSPGSQLLQC